MAARTCRTVHENRGMDLDAKIELLGGLSPARFMRRYWQSEPLLVRNAWPGVRPPLARAQLFALAARDDVEARLVTRSGRTWSLRHGPLVRRSLPPLTQRRWSLLVQGVDLLDDAAHRLLRQFRFVPDARLDDLMVSFATDGGGVGPHVDAYDVFLLQLEGRRRWRVGPVADRTLVKGAPLKLLRRFVPTHDWVLNPGDMLYLPPFWGHDGVAIGECMTGSIGFRAPGRVSMLRDLMQRMADDLPGVGDDEEIYRDPRQRGATSPARVPSALQAFARKAWRRLQRERGALNRVLGEVLTEPKAQVWFETPPAHRSSGGAVRLDRRTRMLYDAHHTFINGESLRVSGRDAELLRRLADQRSLKVVDLERLSRSARDSLTQWANAGWLHET
jgi:50S ribosomal protein L16 3-hydroxylase